MFTNTVWLWIGFNLLVLTFLALDLGVFHRKIHVVKPKEAAVWTAVWIALALTFNLGVYFWRGPQSALEFFTGYLIEEPLSVDNIFVFVLIFTYFAVPAAYQHRVLFWGILGALVMRGVFIVAGTVLLQQFHWTIYVFGMFLVFTGIKMALQKHAELHLERNPLLRLARRLFPVTESYEGGKFLVRRGGKLLVTPMLLVLLVIESTDVLFAVDSVPAVFAVTRDPFIVYTSNVFAILGLRSLYFLLAGAVSKFHYLKLTLSVILVFVGAKMVLADVYKVPITVSLLVIGGLLAVGMVASWLRARRLADQLVMSAAHDTKDNPEAADA